MAEFTFSLTEGQVQVWKRYAALKGCSLGHLVKVMVPAITDELLFCLVHPEICERIEEGVLATLPLEMQETVLGQRERLNLKLREHQPQEN